MAASPESLISGFNLGSMVDKIVVGVMWIFIIAIICAIGYFIYWLLVYKYPVFVVERVGGHLRLIPTKAKKIGMRGDKSKTVKKLFLRRYRKAIKIPSAEAWQDFKGKKALFLGFDGINTFFPLSLQMNSAPLFKPVNYSWLFWHSLQMKETNQLYDERGFWAKHGPAVMWLIVISLTFVLLIILFERLEIISGAIGQLASAVKSVGTQTIAGGV